MKPLCRIGIALLIVLMCESQVMGSYWQERARLIQMAHRLEIAARMVSSDAQRYRQYFGYPYHWVSTRLEQGLAQFESTARRFRYRIESSYYDPHQALHELESLNQLAGLIRTYLYSGQPFRNLLVSFNRASETLQMINRIVYGSTLPFPRPLGSPVCPPKQLGPRQIHLPLGSLHDVNQTHPGLSRPSPYRNGRHHRLKRRVDNFNRLYDPGVSSHSFGPK